MPLVDLDDPEELRARWAALAAVAHATGFDRRWYADEAGYHHQDETGSILRMVRLDGGRSVLFGFHTQYSQTAGSDLLAGSPDWIGQPEVRRLISRGQLGFVYGAFNGTWARASYAGDPWQPADDGFVPIGQWITSDEETAGEMIEWVAEWADYPGGLDELVPFGVQLIRTPEITAELLGEFFDRFGIDPRSPVQPDLPAGAVAADDFNLAVGERLADEPDTAEVSVVEDVVIGVSEGPEDEESYVVPPGISPFTGQPIDESAPYLPPAVSPSTSPSTSPAVSPAVEPQVAPYVQTPYRVETPAHDDDYGVVEKKQGWLRRRRHDEEPAPPSAPEAPTGGPAPGTYLPDGDIGGGLPYGPLPSSEPPRVGGGVHEGEDFYASLFADAPSAAAYQQEAPPADEQDWETAEQPAWSDQDATSEYDPFADDTPPAQPAEEWLGGAWINGEWIEHPGAQPDQAGPDQRAAEFTESQVVQPDYQSPHAEHHAPQADPSAADASGPAFEDDDAPTAEIAAVLDPTEDPEEDEPSSFTGPSPFAPQPEPHQPPTPAARPAAKPRSTQAPRGSLQPGTASPPSGSTNQPHAPRNCRHPSRIPRPTSTRTAPTARTTRRTCRTPRLASTQPAAPTEQPGHLQEPAAQPRQHPAGARRRTVRRCSGRILGACRAV